MPITIIPAADQSGANQGWEILARSIQLGQARRQQRNDNYQNLIFKLSHPDTTEDEQNAILTSDPAAFKAAYGVDISQVGKDVSQFRTAAASVAAPEVAGRAAQEIGTMDLNRAKYAGTKRLLVPRPGGTAKQQQEAATLRQTQVQTVGDEARTREAAARTALATKEMQTRVGESTAQLKATMRIVDPVTGQQRVPTFNEVQDYYLGKIELTPLKPEQDQREKIAYILGQDPNDPIGRVMIGAFERTVDRDKLDLDKLTADIDYTRANTERLKQEWDLINQGLNPKTGAPVNGPDAIKPQELAALGKSWDEVTTRALAPFGLPSRTTTLGPPKYFNREIKTPWGTQLPQLFWQKETADNPLIGAAIFGSGQVDAASVRKDLLAAVPAGSKLKTIEFPVIDKDGLPRKLPLTVDEAVPRILQTRRSLAVTMPAFFDAMRQASPATLIYMANSDPMILQAARAYAPDIYQLITQARGTDNVSQTTPPGAPADDPLLADPNTAPLAVDMRGLQAQIDEINKTLKDATVAPGER